MVATSGNMTVSVRNFVNGASRIKPESISAEDWYGIIWDASRDIELPHQFGEFKSLRGHFETDKYVGIVKRIFDSKMVTHAEWGQAAPGNRYLILHSKGDLPRSWSEAFRSADSKGELPVIAAQYVLFSDRKEIFVLSGTWIPHQTWENESADDYPSAFWYEAGPMTLRNHGDALPDYLRESEDDLGGAGVSILATLAQLAGRVAEEARRLALRADYRHGLLDARLKLLGLA